VIVHLTEQALGATKLKALPKWDLPSRVFASTALVMFVTLFAKSLGAQLSGLLSPVPVIAWPLVVFAHAQGGRANALAVIRGTSIGAIGLIAFFLLVLHFVTTLNLLIVYLFALFASILLSLSAALIVQMWGRKSAVPLNQDNLCAMEVKYECNDQPVIVEKISSGHQA
jgi:hypothetical protein